MRLWAKLIVMVALATATQSYIQSHAATLDDVWFTLRVGIHDLVHGRNACDPALVAAADDLFARARDRAAAELAAAQHPRRAATH